MDFLLEQLREKFESPDLLFVNGGYLRYQVRQTTVQVAISKTRTADIFEEFVLKSALDLSPSPTTDEIADMLGIDPMLVRQTIDKLTSSKNLNINSDDSTLQVEPLTQKIFAEKLSILYPQNPKNIYVIEDFLSENILITKKPLSSIFLGSDELDNFCDQSNNSDERENFQSSIQDFFGEDEQIFVTGFQEIESKKIYRAIGLLIFKDLNCHQHLIKYFILPDNYSQIKDSTEIENDIKNLKNLDKIDINSLLSHDFNHHDEIEVDEPSLNEPIRVYIGLPRHLANKILWVDRRYRTNPLSHIPGGSDVVVEYHNGQVLGYDWIKKPWVYIRTFFAGLIEYVDDEFESLDEIIQLQMTKSKISRVYARKYKNEEERADTDFQEVWNSQTANEMPWTSLKRFAYQSSKQYYRHLNLPSDSQPASLLDYYGYEPEYEDPIDKAERLWGIPDPRLVEDWY
ncbi:hypothetical protein ACOKW7_05270 [Limnospira platensis CENA597]|uniref:hypothetical protein n=1 Tax=Limnospira platensis TaxID=118562 RepID=UPI003D6FA6FC